MKKECQPSPPVRRHRASKLHKPSARETSKLEEKLDGLVALLKSANYPGLENTALANSPLEGLVHGDFEATPGSAENNRIDYGQHTHNPSPTENGLPGSIHTPTTSSSSVSSPLSNVTPKYTFSLPLEPSPEEADVCLNRFRSSFIKHLPYIVMPPSITAHQLRQDRPLLWMAVMTVASNSSTQQISMSKEIRGILANEVFLEGTRNMDILLAVLVCAAW
jgi:hypothetical protein